MKTLCNKKGVTLMEMIVVLFVLSMIMVAVTSIFAPMLQTFRRANNFAEANPIFDNIAMLMLHDINSALEVRPALQGGASDENEWDVVIQTVTHRIAYRMMDDVPSPVTGNTVTVIQRNLIEIGIIEYLFDVNFYRGKRITFEVEEHDGLVELTLFMTSPDGWNRERTYVARPPGLAR